MNSMDRDASPVAKVSAGGTPQIEVWKGQFGREYTERNTFDSDALDALYRKNYGVTRTQVNERFLSDVPKDARILEVGCNTGNQLALLQKMGYRDLSGVELQPYALEIARSRTEGIALKEGSALNLPYQDAAFDLVFTSGVLIHIAPADLPRALTEIHRCAGMYIWGMEYYAADVTEVNYRKQNGLLWKMDYARRYAEIFPDLTLIKEERLPYLDNPNIDTIFLLRKTQGAS
jgi:pseudaminic acid biosynthesis-associated methylase